MALRMGIFGFFLASLVILQVQCFVVDYVRDPNEEKTVILMAFSGLGCQSVYRHDLPMLDKMAQDGVLALQKRAAFQTESLPALHTLVTGLYPEKHGMLSNKMHDLSSGARFDVANTDEAWWSEAEPVWVSNEKRNGTSALCFWPAHDVAIAGTKATHTCSLNGTSLVDPFKELTLNSKINQAVLSMSDRVKKVLDWVKMKQRPNFMAVYFEEPLKSAIAHDTASKEMQLAYETINGLIAKLYNGLKDVGLLEKVNIVITSDANVVDVADNKIIYLEDYLDSGLKSGYDVIDSGPIMTILPKSLSDTETLFEKWNSSNQNMRVYRKQDLPDHFHFQHVNRTMPLVIVANRGWQIQARRITDPNDKRKAVIGYAADLEASYSFLLAHGPAFRKGVRLPSIESVDVYQAICAAMKLEPRPHDGSGYVLSKIMAKQEKWYWHIAESVVQSKTALIGVVVLFVVLLFAALYLLVHVLYNASSRCHCLDRKGNKKDSPYAAANREINDGRKHLLADEDELTGSEIDEDSDVNEYEVKYAKP